MGRAYLLRLKIHPPQQVVVARVVIPLTFSAVTRRKAICSVFPDDSAMAGEDQFPHLYLSSHADVFCALPAT